MTVGFKHARSARPHYPMRLRLALLSIVPWLIAAASAAFAAEPRPWLCRDKPVFSTSAPSHIEVGSHDTRRWQLFLMQFDPSGGHDGFTITNTYALEPGNRHAGESLSPGHFFAVALYAAGGHWICQASTRDERTPGTIASLCYGANEGGCDVTLTVRSATGN
jgi:hypothetical protein